MSNELECKRCHLKKPENEFTLNRDGKWLSRCNYCREQHNYACKKYLAEQRKIKKEEQIKYNELHKEEIEKLKQEKEQVRKDKNIDKCKKWRTNNADKVKQDSKEYYETTKDILYKNYDCECGGKYCIAKKTRHQMSNRHQQCLESQSIQ